MFLIHQMSESRINFVAIKCAARNRILTEVSLYIQQSLHRFVIFQLEAWTKRQHKR